MIQKDRSNALETMKAQQHKSKLLGAILGQAIGDAMGSQTEFHKGRLVNDLGNTWGYPFPAFSDDTQMMLAIAEALLTVQPKTAQDSEVEAFMQECSSNFIKWRDGDPRWGQNDRSPGGTCLGGVYQLRSNGVQNWRSTGSLDGGKGNGGAMRASVVGCWFWQNATLAYQYGALTSVPTHNNLESLLASGAIAQLVALSIQGCSLRQALGIALETMANYRRNLVTIPVCKDQDPGFAIGRMGAAFGLVSMSVSQFKQMNGNDGKGVEAVAAAIHANAKFTNYSDIICNLANYTGDSDTTPAIGGALAGARYGADFIRRDWKQRIEKSKYLHDLAERIWQVVGIKEDTAQAVART